MSIETDQPAADEVLNDSRSPRMVRIVAAVIAVAAVAGVTVALTRYHGRGHEQRASRVLTIQPGGAAGSQIDASSFGYFVEISNTVSDWLTVAYPIVVSSPDGHPVPAASAGIFALNTRGADGGLPDDRSPRLTRIGPRQGAEIVLEVRPDCVQAAAQQRMPGGQPVIHVTLIDHLGTVDFPIVTPGGYPALVRQACGH